MQRPCLLGKLLIPLTFSKHRCAIGRSHVKKSDSCRAPVLDDGVLLKAPVRDIPGQRSHSALHSDCLPQVRTANPQVPGSSPGRGANIFRSIRVSHPLLRQAYGCQAGRRRYTDPLNAAALQQLFGHERREQHDLQAHERGDLGLLGKHNHSLIIRRQPLQTLAIGAESKSV